MTIKNWNSLPQNKKEAVANILGNIDKLDTESTKNQLQIIFQLKIN